MSVVGQRVPRVDAREKVTGEARFVDDLAFPGMLYAAVVRSTEPRARILSMDLESVLSLPGVVAVAGPDDIPGGNNIPLILPGHPLLAPGETNFCGQALGLVGAETREAADLAAGLVRVEYEPRTPLLDPLDARLPGAPGLYGEDNTFGHHVVRRGDVERGFREAFLVVENTYHTPAQEHAYLEPQGAIAVPTPDLGIVVYGSMQCPFYVQRAIAHILGLPLGKVRIVQTTTGGAFGGKEDAPSEVGGQAAVLAWKTRRPVKLVYHREEDMHSMSKRHPAHIRYKTGVKEDGTLVAVEVQMTYDGGAFGTLSPVVLWRATVHAAGAYRCPNVRVDAWAVATNKEPSGAFRGFGAPQVLFAAESQMDEVAAKLGMDPLALRKHNILRTGDETATGQKLRSSVGSLQTIREASRASDYRTKRARWGKDRGPVRKGIGVSTINYGAGLGGLSPYLTRAGAFVQVHADGSALYAVGTTEMGQGMHTVLAQIVAEELGLRLDQVTATETDTSRVPDSGPTVASRATIMSGNALRDACARVRKNLWGVGASILGVPLHDVLGEGGVLYAGQKQDKSVAVEDVARECISRRVHLAAQGWFRAPKTSWDPKRGQGDAYMVYAWATNIAEVEVDLETGVVRLVRLTAAHDVGRAINPVGVEGQIEGGSLQGVGYALTEEVLRKDGRIINPDFSTYIIPTPSDAPEITPVIVESRFSKGPHGAKGFAEQPLMGVAPAVANAVYHATGLRIRELPLTPERLKKEMERSKR
ncbi:MAG: xanthine dehydrogenase family protein [Candidatus Eisenbacteria sp.]|nr:xanthine dehydrogenase family protein [Candidatus Eisenbacteria bacterium]